MKRDLITVYEILPGEHVEQVVIHTYDEEVANKAIFWAEIQGRLARVERSK